MAAKITSIIIPATIQSTIFKALRATLLKYKCFSSVIKFNQTAEPTMTDKVKIVFGKNIPYANCVLLSAYWNIQYLGRFKKICIIYQTVGLVLVFNKPTKKRSSKHIYGLYKKHNRF